MIANDGAPRACMVCATRAARFLPGVCELCRLGTAQYLIAAPCEELRQIWILGPGFEDVRRRMLEGAVNPVVRSSMASALLEHDETDAAIAAAASAIISGESADTHGFGGTALPVLFDPKALRPDGLDVLRAALARKT